MFMVMYSKVPELLECRMHTKYYNQQICHHCYMFQFNKLSSGITLQKC